MEGNEILHSQSAVLKLYFSCNHYSPGTEVVQSQRNFMLKNINILNIQKQWEMDFPGAPVVKTLPHYRACGFNPWLGNKDSTCHKLAKKLMRKELYSPLSSIKSDPNTVSIARHIIHPDLRNVFHLQSFSLNVQLLLHHHPTPETFLLCYHYYRFPFLLSSIALSPQDVCFIDWLSTSLSKRASFVL